MEQQSNDQRSGDKKTSKKGTTINQNVTVVAESTEQNQPSNQITGESLTIIEEETDHHLLACPTEDSAYRFYQTSSISLPTPTVLDQELISVCGCLLSDQSSYSEETKTLKRKRRILANVQTVETYLRVRRIPELVRFILTKIMCCKPLNVELFVSDLLDACMLFRSGHGNAPVLFEERHLEAVIKSFDPGDRGWLTAGQVRRAYTTLGITPKSNLEVKTPTKEVLNLLRKAQERELLSLISAGLEQDDFYNQDF